MDGDPDVKRPRLDRDLALYQTPAPRGPPITPALPKAEPHPHSAGPTAPPHPFSPSQLPPGHQFQPHQPPQPATPLYREPLPDPRVLSQYQQPPGPPVGTLDHRPGYGPVEASHSRPFPPDGPVSRRQSVSTTPQVAEQHRGPPPPPTPQDTHPGHMEHVVAHQGYPPPAMEQHYVNGAAPNGLPYHPPQDPYTPGSVAPPPHTYASPPVGAYGPPPGYTQGPSNYASVKRKQVRAQQACNNCRQRKQKCDEGRPCSYCKVDNLDCEYKEVPPPKTDRNMQMLIEKAERSEELIIHLSNKLEQLSQTMKSGGVAITKSEPSSAGHGQPESYEEEIAPTKPEEHHTGAHHLMNKWSAIKEFFGKAGIVKEEYVQETEEQRSRLDPYDWAFQTFEGETPQDAVTGRSPSSTGYPTDMSSGSSPTQYPAAWQPKQSGPNAKLEQSNAGGLRPDGKLALDERTVWRLRDSYIKHMWIIHPFFDLSELQRMMEGFIASYSSASFSPAAYPGALEPYEPYSGIGIKRKRATATTGDQSTPSSPGGFQADSSRKERIQPIETAIVLLVLALGKVLEHEGYLLQDRSPSQSRNTGTPGTMFQIPHTTPSQPFIKPSPPSSSPHQPIRMGMSPVLERPPSAAENRGSPGSGAVGQDKRDRERRPPQRNMDIIPGLGYFAAASLILGSQPYNGIEHAQANLLAGLYMGQLGRVLESWNYIYTASGTVVVLLRSKYYENLKVKPKDGAKAETMGFLPELDNIHNTVAFLYWSTLQLESDIRAELDKLPPSLVWGYEEDFRMPSHLMGVKGAGGSEYAALQNDGKLDVRDVCFHYCAQIQIRNTLNRAHVALYKREDQESRKKTGKKISWADAPAPVLWAELRAWREQLHYFIRWDQEDERLASDINGARLRGKYYGAAYIITRPYLHAALYQMKPEDLARVDWNKHSEARTDNAYDTLPALRYSWPHEVDQIIWACKQCIDAAINSTVAFDNYAAFPQKRPRVTNIHGTAAAQFSNILVLAAAYKNPYLRQLVPAEKLSALIDRTIILLTRLSPLSPVFAMNRRVLEVVRSDLEALSSQSSTPATGYGRHGSMQSVHSSFSGA